VPIRAIRVKHPCLPALVDAVGSEYSFLTSSLEAIITQAMDSLIFFNETSLLVVGDDQSIKSSCLSRRVLVFAHSVIEIPTIQLDDDNRQDTHAAAAELPQRERASAE
jgi:hypothetical protein